MPALIVVDVQNDFLPGGSLAVPGGDEIIPVINRFIAGFSADKTFFTRDMHPQTHKSFASNHVGKHVFDQIKLNGVPQTLWPDHCVVGSKGAGLAEALMPFHPLTRCIDKGMDPQYDSYSAFEDSEGKVTELPAMLIDLGYKEGDELYVCGLATDYCVSATALSAVRFGYCPIVILDACRGVNSPVSVEKAICEMLAAGVMFVHSKRLPSREETL